jgi:hypothetical protein
MTADPEAPTEEERAENWREVEELPRQDRFLLMFGRIGLNSE